MTWWEGVLIGWVLLLIAVVFLVARDRDGLTPTERADAEEEANMCRYLLAKNPELKRELLG